MPQKKGHDWKGFGSSGAAAREERKAATIPCNNDCGTKLRFVRTPRGLSKRFVTAAGKELATAPKCRRKAASA